MILRKNSYEEYPEVLDASTLANMIGYNSNSGAFLKIINSKGFPSIDGEKIDIKRSLYAKRSVIDFINSDKFLKRKR